MVCFRRTEGEWRFRLYRMPGVLASLRTSPSFKYGDITPRLGLLFSENPIVCHYISSHKSLGFLVFVPAIMPAFPLRRSTPQDGNPSDSKRALFVGIASMILALCSLVLCARFVGRRVTKNVVGADDYLVIIAHVRGNFSIPCPKPDLNIEWYQGSSLCKNL